MVLTKDMKNFGGGAIFSKILKEYMTSLSLNFYTQLELCR